MARSTLRCGLVAATLSLGHAALAQTPHRTLGDSLRVDPIPAVHAPITPQPTPDQAAHLESLIDQLVAIDQEAFRTISMDRHAFQPVPALAEEWYLPSASFRVRGGPLPPAYLALVSLGPRAIPALLKHLTDARPTGAAFMVSAAGQMHHHPNLVTRPHIEQERKIVGEWRSRPAPNDDPPVERHAITVGDVCLSALGQITGRHYLAVESEGRFQLGISSPSHDPWLAERLRALWGGDPSATLVEWLLRDFATRHVDPASMEWFHFADRYQADGALRLLYYFPDVAGDLIAARLDALRLDDPEFNTEPWKAQERVNGVDAAGFIAAVRWCELPVVRSAVVRCFERTTSPSVLLETLPAVPRDRAEDVSARLRAILHQPSPIWGEGTGQFLLIAALADWHPEAARTALRERIESNDADLRHRVVGLIRWRRLDSFTDLLVPLLNDRRPSGAWYPIGPDRNGPRADRRLCDDAAEAIATFNPRVSFKLEGDHAALDVQIAEMRRRLSSQ